MSNEESKIHETLEASFDKVAKTFNEACVLHFNGHYNDFITKVEEFFERVNQFESTTHMVINEFKDISAKEVISYNSKINNYYKKIALLEYRTLVAIKTDTTGYFNAVKRLQA